MEDGKGARARARAQSEATPRRREVHLSPAAGEGEQPENAGEDEDTTRTQFNAPRRAATAAIGTSNLRQVHSPSLPEETEHGVSTLRRRSTAISRRSARRSTAANRSRLGTVGLAGPEDTTQIEAAAENYVSPGYAALNPAYEQPLAAKPVWSLAKPLPRVVRPGMIPTKSEILDARTNGQAPAENIHNAGVDIDPNDLEAGRVQLTANPAKLSAQLKDSRAQREQNFVSDIQRRGTTTSRISTRPTRASSTASQTAQRRRAESRVSITQRPLTPAWEDGAGEAELGEEEKEDREAHASAEGAPLSPSAEQAVRLSIQHSGGDGLNTQLEAIPENRVPRPEPRLSQESAISQSTIKIEDYDDIYDDMTALKLEIENPPLFEEVHNNHTSWSVIRTQNREFLAELLAVVVQETIGFAADVSATLSTTSNVNTTAWAWGFATMIGIYISGGISGAHLNPAITMMLWFYRGFPKRKMIPYFAAQFLGAFMAALIAYGMYLASIKNYELTNDPVKLLNGFVTSCRYDYIDAATAFFNEFVGTAFLACTVLALGDDQNAPPGAGMNSLVIGLVITALNLGFANQTGAALNPSRDFGPRLAMLALGYGSDLFTNPYWFYGPWAGCICGAFVGAALYDVCIFTGGESPINYPWTRTKRSYRKGKAKWARRLRLEKKQKAEHATEMDAMGVS